MQATRVFPAKIRFAARFRARTPELGLGGTTDGSFIGVSLVGRLTLTAIMGRACSRAVALRYPIAQAARREGQAAA
jgi:hypothetical protein